MPINTDQPVAYRARWVIPSDGPPIAHGIVTAAGGRIVAVGTRTDESNLIDLGHVAILPALINAHAHLEFSLFQQPIGQPGESFARWLKQVVSWRREQPAVQGQEQLALEQGLRESAAAGVALLGEIATPLFAEVWHRREATLAHVRFLELLSLNPERVPALTSVADAYLRSSDATGMRGLSPHAPYTVHPELLARAVRLSADFRVPLAMHLAESREELELLASQTGPLVELLQSLTAWYPGSLTKGLRPLDFLKALAPAHRAVIAHGNYLNEEEINFLAEQRHHMSVVYCPRTQAYFDHDPYPFAPMLQAGVCIAVGTDSRASNPDLSLWRELQFIHQQHPGVSPAAILRMGTLAGAQALGVAETFGSITVGKIAKFAVIPLPTDCSDPLAALFNHSANAGNDNYNLSPLFPYSSAE